MTTFGEARDFLLTNREDYEAAAEGFRWPDVDGFNWAIDWFDGVLAAGDGGDRTALTIVGTNAATLTFRELSERSNRVANGLRDRGVRAGDRLLLMLDNRTALWEVMLAAMKIGAVTIPATTLLTREDLETRIVCADASYLVTGCDLAVGFDDLPLSGGRYVVGGRRDGWSSYDDLLNGDPSFDPGRVTHADDPILLYFTSGTTARPKLVVHTHRSYGIGALSTMYWLGLREGDIHLNVSSPGWAKHAWSCLFAPWNAGAAVFIPNLGRFDPTRLLDAISEGGVTSMCAPPTVWRMLVQKDLARWRTGLTSLCGAGEPLNPEVIEAVRRAWGLTIRDGFGQTETTAQIANTPGQPLRDGSVGRALPGYDVALLDADGRACDEGEISLRLSPRPAGLMLGYRLEDGTLSPVEGDWYRTGDVATRDDDGYFTYVGRADDVFKAADYRISPFELESALIEHPAIIEAAVVPAPDPVRLAVPKAYVSLVDGHEASRETAIAIFRHIRLTLAPYKRIRRLQFGELPKTISGKIRRVELRKAEVENGRLDRRDPLEFREEDFVDELS